MSRWRRLVMADPVHGIMAFDRKDPVHRLLLEVVNSRAFQRLRRIKQMGLAEFVFPGAVHTRFNHSLGAAYLMSRAIQVLRYERSNRELLQSPYGETGISLECLLMMGILLHDIGHSPLSHTLEDVLELNQRGLNHDYYWLPRILTEDEGLQAIWQQYGVSALPQALQDFMGLTPGQPKHFLAMLVSSQLDMDRLDYLLRDSHFLGTQYGNIELDRLVGSMEIGKTPDGSPAVAVTLDALPALEHYLFGRHQAYKMALHPLDKASEALLRFVLQRFQYVKRMGMNPGHPASELYALMEQGQQLSVSGYLRMDDYYLWDAIHCWSLYSEDPVLKELAGRMMRHDLPKFIDLAQFRQPVTADMQQAALDKLQDYYQQRELPFEFGFQETIVSPKPLYLTRPLREPIWVATPDRGLVELPEVSSLLDHTQGVKAKGGQHLWFVWDRAAKKFLHETLLQQL